MRDKPMGEKSETIARYRSYVELLEEPTDMTPEERRRLWNIKRIPNAVREVLLSRTNDLLSQIKKLESERDALIDFLNGEETEDE